MKYEDYQHVRREAETRELAERAQNLRSPRPALQASVTDQILRDVLDRLAALEATAALRSLSDKPVPRFLPTK